MVDPSERGVDRRHDRTPFAVLTLQIRPLAGAPGSARRSPPEARGRRPAPRRGQLHAPDAAEPCLEVVFAERAVEDRAASPSRAACRSVLPTNRRGRRRWSVERSRARWRPRNVTDDAPIVTHPGGLRSPLLRLSARRRRYACHSQVESRSRGSCQPPLASFGAGSGSPPATTDRRGARGRPAPTCVSMIRIDRRHRRASGTAHRSVTGQGGVEPSVPMLPRPVAGDRASRLARTGAILIRPHRRLMFARE